ncbi:unnamed protein product [Anisakis simplex]|uniref:Nuclear transition protein 2 n=1 Tax=Anisakis simplex TaxID=6269 RepID=A0A0M3K909_ANISI|nr:unnamed protein product [Anisakis simplex]
MVGSPWMSLWWSSSRSDSSDSDSSRTDSSQSSRCAVSKRHQRRTKRISKCSSEHDSDSPPSYAVVEDKHGNLVIWPQRPETGRYSLAEYKKRKLRARKLLKLKQEKQSKSKKREHTKHKEHHEK